MAKQYIPGIGGLLTEPNPVDAPSNTLTEAQNVIIDQNGKIQARHGFNVNQDESSNTFSSNFSETLVPVGSRTFVPPIANPDSTISDSLTNYVHYSTFLNYGDVFFKIIEFKNSSNEVLSGLFVKQRKSEYIVDYNTTLKKSTIWDSYPTVTGTTVNRYYQIDANSGKLIKMDQLPYDHVKNVFATKLSLYAQTEDGITECNVDDVFDAVSNKFFTIRWPSFPRITHSIKRSDIYANWLSSNQKVGIRVVFFRELGYSEKEEQIYESQPSPIYEIVNNGKEGIPSIMLDFLTDVNNQQLYKKWNEFTKLNNGRKFGIKIYRTKSVPIDENLQVEFFECFQSIYFDNAFTGKLDLSTAVDNYEWFRFTTAGFATSTSPLLNVNDILSYISTGTDENNNIINYQYSKIDIKYSTYSLSPAVLRPIQVNDIIPIRLLVSNRRLDVPSGQYEYQFTLLNDTNVDSFSTQISTRLFAGNLLTRRISVKIDTTNLNTVLKIYRAPDYTLQINYPNSTVSIPSKVKFIGTAPSGFTAGVEYHVVPGNTSLSLTVGGGAIQATSTSSALYTIELYYHPLIEQSYFIRSYNLELNLNDNALTSIGEPLYTNPNSDGSFYTNAIAPDSEFITPYKDFHLHVGVKNPLEAKISVITQPSIEQHSFVPRLNNSTFYKSVTFTMTSGNPQFTSTSIGLSNSNAVYFTGTPPTPFVANTPYYVVNAATYPGSTFSLSATVNGDFITPSSTGTANMTYSRWATSLATPQTAANLFLKTTTNLRASTTDRSKNGQLFFESPIVGDKRVEIIRYPSSSTDIPYPGHIRVDLNISVSAQWEINNTIRARRNIDHYYLSENLYFNATVFEKPCLTLRLVSNDDITTDFLIQTEPLYNRKGYYSLKNESDTYDDQYLTYDLSFNEMNSHQKSRLNKIFQPRLDEIYHVVGEKEGQISADGTHPGYETQSVTTNTSNTTITLVSPDEHNLTSGTTVEFVTSAPGGFAVDDTYYVNSTGPASFTLSSTKNGTAIQPTTAGTFSLKITTPNQYWTKWINDSANDIYYNSTNNTITLKNLGNIDIKKFEAPGILMIQSCDTDVILFTYSSIDSSQSSSNLYVFKSVALQYINRTFRSSTDSYFYDPAKLNQAIVTNPKYFRIGGTTSLFFLKGTSVDNLPLYSYAKDIIIESQPTKVKIDENSIEIQERYKFNSTEVIYPIFTFLPHRKMSDIPIGFFKKSKNHSFLGINSKDAGEYIDLYAWQIVNKFNIELQNKGFDAYLTKGEGIGEIIITYPDGKSIKMMNGAIDGANFIYPGNHKFLPDIGKNEFIEIAKRDTQDIYTNNQAFISRRQIPEITPIGSFINIGKPDKKFIGFAQNSDDLFIFKEDGIFRVIDAGDITSNIPNPQVFQFSTNLICQAGGSIQEINDEIIFLSQYGFMSISGGNVSNISNAIQRDVLTLIQVSPKSRIKSFVNESKQLYYCTLINEVDSTLDVKSGTYIFNTKTRQWSFMDHEILFGLEDSQKRNLVAYRQKAILGIYNGSSSNWTASDATNHILRACNVSYPMQTTNYVDNFYYISRERHTNNIMFNAKDQYDYVSENMMSTGTFAEITNGFTITLPVSQNAFIFHYAQKLFKMFTPPTTIFIPPGNPLITNTSQYAIVDSPIQMFLNRDIMVELLRTGQSVYEYYQVKLVKFEYLGTTSYQIKYTFEYVTSTVPTSPITLQSLKVLAGIPVKITFNPESGNNPDSNKLFQEYMIHTETTNKGTTMAFKTDSRSSFTSDRRFAYDPNAVNRNIFRTYIPTIAARGRYLIRQVKHDVPLENLIITGQTMVMRDSGSTRVQKDKDN